MLDACLPQAAAVWDKLDLHLVCRRIKRLLVRLKGTQSAMPATTDRAYLAHIDDIVIAIEEQLGQHREVQQNILAVLNELLATNQAQSEMLAEILGAASQEAEPSPVAQALAALAARIQELDENQTNLIARVAELPEAVGKQFEASLKEWSTGIAAQH